MKIVNCHLHGLVKAHSNGKNNNPRCSICSIARSKATFRSNKEKAVAYKGGKCEICGYNKCMAAFDFHHINPEEKDFTIAGGKYLKWELMKPELDKCRLLCANCHREVHAGVA